MKLRFILTLILLTAVLLGWTYIHHQYQESRSFRLQQLSQLPVFVYLDSKSALDSLGLMLQAEFAEIDSVLVESSELVAGQLVLEHQLPIEPTTLRDYSLPSVMTLVFKPDYTSFEGRDRVAAKLRARGIPARDIELQQEAWDQVKQELDYLGGRWSNATVLTALLVFLLCVYVRLFLFLAGDNDNRGRKTTVIQSIRITELKRWQSALLLLIPTAVTLGGYHLWRLLAKLPDHVGWLFFAIQFGTVFTAVYVAVLLDGMRHNDPESDIPAIRVATTLPSDEVDS